jgi:hypothetical protein
MGVLSLVIATHHVTIPNTPIHNIVVRQRCVEGFNSGVEGLMSEKAITSGTQTSSKYRSRYAVYSTYSVAVWRGHQTVVAVQVRQWIVCLLLGYVIVKN